MINIPQVRKPFVILTAAIILLVVIIFLEERISILEKRAKAFEIEAVEGRKSAESIIGLRSSIQNLQETLTGGEPVLKTIERISQEEGINIAAVQSAGTKKMPPYREALTSFRVQSVPLIPLINLLHKLESSRSGLIIKELTIRKSILKQHLLDAEIIVSLLEKEE